MDQPVKVIVAIDARGAWVDEKVVRELADRIVAIMGTR